MAVFMCISCRKFCVRWERDHLTIAFLFWTKGFGARWECSKVLYVCDGWVNHFVNMAESQNNCEQLKSDLIPVIADITYTTIKISTTLLTCSDRFNTIEIILKK